MKIDRCVNCFFHGIDQGIELALPRQLKNVIARKVQAKMEMVQHLKQSLVDRLVSGFAMVHSTIPAKIEPDTIS